MIQNGRLEMQARMKSNENGTSGSQFKQELTVQNNNYCIYIFGSMRIYVEFK